MYDTLYTAWLREGENLELQRLSKDFFEKLAEYIGRIRREGRMLDKKSVKAKLIAQELLNVKQLLKELFALRLEKLVGCAGSLEFLDRGLMTLEEEKMLGELRPAFERFHAFFKDASRGKVSRVEENATHAKRVLLRFTQDVPAIVGADLKVYGPFLVEDVATLPFENSKVLVKHGVAMEIETR